MWAKTFPSCMPLLASRTVRSMLPSCIGDGEDGLLYYNGFTVTTYRENGKETVQDAY